VAGTILITGASGYLGGLLARRYEDAGWQVLALSRKSADLSDPEPFADVTDGSRKNITAIVHAGAVTRFDVEPDLAREVNVEGTEKVVAFARTCPRLESFGLVSTVYSTGLRPGRVAEELYDDSLGFANAYERSKWQAEQVVAAVGDDLPWRILRVATVIADDASGRVTQHNAFHETLKLWFHGLLPLVPGDPATPLYLVTGDFVADALVTLMQPEHRGVFHVAHDASHSLTLAHAVDVVSDAFEAVESFRRRRVLRPLLGDEETFDLLTSGVGSFGGGMVRQALQSVVPFARQLFVVKELDTARMQAALGSSYRAPDPAELVRHTCEHLVATRWGRDAVA
jgi:nucleoside-diphosphate-sugar epimerase